jgi:hypothetical protein
MLKKTVSVSNELTLVMDAVRGVRLLTKAWIDSYGLDADIPHTISALLVLLHERLRLLDRVVQGQLDPRLAWCPQNDAASTFIDGEDQHLAAWSERRVASHHEAEWKRAKRRIASEKPRKGQKR